MPQQRKQSFGDEQTDGRRKALKDFQSHYVKYKFEGQFEVDCANHMTELLEMCGIFDIPPFDRFYFLRLTLESYARQFYYSVKTRGVDWKTAQRELERRYAPRSNLELGA